MFKKLFFRDIEDDKEKQVYETVDPVVEQRRKEKFSTPFMNDEEIVKEERPVSTKKKEKKIDQKQKVEKKERPPYEMSQIISPISGLKQSKKITEVKPKKTPKKIKKRKETDQLVPVFSPFKGPKNIENEKPLKPQKIKKAKPQEKEETVEDNLRNIASIIEEEKDQLKIIEERTGEFKLDFSYQDKDTFIDEIDDSMSLDELMSLYEKKFKD
jgi:26S proteasome regulatory complex component